MKKKSIAILSLIPIMALCSCKITRDLTNTSRTSTSREYHDPVQMFCDNTFACGFNVSAATGSVIGDGPVKPEGWQPDNHYTRNTKFVPNDIVGGIPLWSVRQHGDVYGLGDEPHRSDVVCEVKDGEYKIEDPSKKIIANKDTGTLYLELDGSVEYPNRDRYETDPAWAHLLMEGALGGEIVSGDVDKIVFTTDITLKKFERHMRVPDQAYHAAQFLLYLQIYSTVPEDASHYFFFGIPLFDNRYTRIPEEGHIDSGGSGATGNYIYGMNSGWYLPNGLPQGQKQSINIDIKPYLTNALTRMQSVGFYTHTSVDELSFNNMNIGYELPGTYDVGIEISNFALTAYY